MKCFLNAKTYLNGVGMCIRNIVFDRDVISVGNDEVPRSAEVLSLPDGAVVLPGFIDEHVHGAGGADVMDGSAQSLSVMAQTLAKEGTARFLATTMTQSEENILNAAKAVKQYMSDGGDGAGLLGIHLEGPFISSAQAGAQPEEFISAPDIKLFEKFNSACGGNIKMVTVAPESKGADKFISYLKENGVTVSIGHTSADYQTAMRAVNCGASSVTHTFNAQTGIHHRDIGVAGAALTCDGLYTELIADKIHVSVPAMSLLYKNKPRGKLVLITDAMRAKGMGEGISELGGQTVIVKDSQARLEDGTLAGSVLKMNEAVKNLIECGAEFADAVNCATLNVAKNLHIADKYGSIAVGKRADFTVLDDRFNVLLTIRDGRIIYKNC